jgi:uncharacterized SAM-binding protein YcdF (DUF218 family)
MLYFFKQLVNAVASPLCVALLAAGAALVCGVLGKRRAQRWLLVSSAIWAYASSTPIVGFWLLRPLEQRYAALRDDAPLPQVGYVVVLGSYYDPTPTLPITAAIDEEGLVRTVEGLRLLRLLPGARLVVTGGGIAGRGHPAAGNARLARAFGVPDDALIVLESALDTAGEARDVAGRLGPDPFLLVTTASHMPRAMALMHRAGANAIAAPTGQQTKPGAHFGWADLLPSSGGLRASERAAHEYLGFAAIAIGLGKPATGT